jgi:glutathione synthase/RimK-type ligase-like ATP-grasp enzyme
MKLLKIAIGKNPSNWHDKFALAIENKISLGLPIRYEIIDLSLSNWLDKVSSFDLIIWKPDYMGAYESLYFKEKIYILEKFLSKRVIPNYNTIWHYESKIAQSYIFHLYNIPIPKTYVTFNFLEAKELLKSSNWPLVFKKSQGAASKNVWLVRNLHKASKLMDNAYCNQMYRETRLRIRSKFKSILKIIRNRWFLYFVLKSASGNQPTGALYWQEFIPGNDADLRITVIGDKFAYGYWRKNRPKDFRASGSGRVDYHRPIPKEMLLYCVNINKKFKFDSMAYDLIYKDSKMVITEMSYAYVDHLLYNTSGYYLVNDDNTLIFEKGHKWPQELWVDWALIVASNKFQQNNTFQNE